MVALTKSTYIVLSSSLKLLPPQRQKRMADAAKDLESDLPPIPTTIEGSFSGDDLNNISDLDATFASSCFLEGHGSSVARTLAGDSGGTEADATPASCRAFE